MLERKLIHSVWTPETYEMQKALKEKGIDVMLQEAREDMKTMDAAYIGAKGPSTPN